ncbi:hypothetical protein F7Q99_05785 [Streptomyces kaniharaensis]|uniref:ABC transporter permease n=1 Tax=Streptomyces kaniharaensis TaxID=212423 RepID=A0A6N7KJV7_9ACTN|nr:hypothetical protein [Streptomyces kaniharaensis]MQS11812.1 hypothetical protein [Streptomyces kaniharaensis]
MTVPNTPPDPTRADVHAVPDTATDPFAPPPAPDGGAVPPLPAELGRPAEPAPSLPQRLLPELRVGAGTVLACILLGLVMAGLWAWLAPKVPLVVDRDRILYVDPEGEQRAGADAVFVLIGLGMGIVTALGAFLVTRRRGGGIAVAVGLTIGGLLGSLGAWRLGRWLGPSDNLIAEARRVGNGGHFTADIDLGAHSALLAWPMAAMVVLLVLSAAFGKREEDPPPYWAGPSGQAAVDGQVPVTGQAPVNGVAPEQPEDGTTRS